MENSAQQTPQTKAFEILGGIFNTQVVAALSQANIFETIGQDSKSLDELATRCKVHENVLSRALRYATFIGVVNLSDGRYSITEVGKYLLKEYAR